MELTVFLEDEEIERLLRAFNLRMRNGIMMNAIIRLMGYCGLRASECIGHEKRAGGGLRIQDVNLNTGQITIRDSKDTRGKDQRRRKTKNGRIVFAGGETLEALRKWWTDIRAIQSMLEPYDDDYFFVNRNGMKISNAQLRKTIRIYAEKAGIPPEKRHAHALRHSAGTRFYRETKDLLTVQKILGHSSPTDTARYAHVTGADVEEIMRRVQKKN